MMLLVPGALVMFLVPALALTTSVAAQPDLEAGYCAGSKFTVTTSPTGTCDPGVTTTSFQTTVTNIVNIISFIVGAIAVLMIIYGGFRYITSGGDATKVTAAKNTILYGLIGLIIVAVAQILVQFVVTKVNINF